MNTSIVLLSFAALTMGGCDEEIPVEYIDSEITAMLEKQQDAWNHGDVDGFMLYYENSETMRFISSQGMMLGHKNLKERYKNSYPDPETMGKLLFEILEIIPVGKENAYVIGKWTLIRESDQPGGYFTLLFAKTTEGWRIISDHTS
jgi:hypothetical protein